ncbi:MAG: hypothetical protein ACOY32_16745 [Thermodesulfobacteriota bacterium]
MECERLNRLVRSWYVQVQEEALAPARMVEFMEKHLQGCSTCLADPDVRSEVKKITDIVLPPSKQIKQIKEEDESEEFEEESPSSSDVLDDGEEDEERGEEDLIGEDEYEDDEEEDPDFDPSLMDEE